MPEPRDQANIMPAPEIANQPELPNAEAQVEQAEISESEQSIQQALKAFSNMAGEARSQRFLDKKGINEIADSLRSLALLAQNANPREAGYRQIIQATEKAYPVMHAVVGRLMAQAESPGLNINQMGAHLETLLRQATSDQASLAQISDSLQSAAELFQQAQQTIEANRQSQLREAENIHRISQELAQWASGFHHRAEADLRQDLYQALPGRYAAKSSEVVKAIREVGQRMTTADRRLSERNQQYQAQFAAAIRQILES